jgi:adenylate cyclase
MNQSLKPRATAELSPQPHDVVQRVQLLCELNLGRRLPKSAEDELLAMAARLADGALVDAAGKPRLPEAGAPMSEHEVTIVLADLRGFAALASTLPGARMMDQLNRVMARLSEVIFRHQGRLERFTGDTLMVVFGLPQAEPDDVRRALTCAAEMQVAMRDLNLEFLQDQQSELHLGIGVNTGRVMAGRFGSEAFGEATVIGDGVKLASRIDAFSLRGQVLISESTYERSWSFISATAPMDVHVQGRAEPVRVRELVAIPSLRLKVPRLEFRRSHRVDVRLPCVFYKVDGHTATSQSHRATLRDVGYHGVQMELDAALPIGTVVQLEFDLTLVDFHTSDIRAEVMKLKQSGQVWVAGLEFRSILPATQMKIQQFVQMLVVAQ